jgi:hypothetical protein
MVTFVLKQCALFMRVRKRFDAEKIRKIEKSEQVSVVTKSLLFVMTERSLRTHFASILGFEPFFNLDY